MSDIKHLLEKMDQFAGQAVGQKPGDQVRGTEKATKKKSGEHPFKGRLVGASESAGSLLKELEQELNRPGAEVKRDLFREFKEFKQSVEEGAPELLKAEMPLVRHIEKELADHGWDRNDPEYEKVFKHTMSMYRKFGNVDAIKRGVAEEFNPADNVRLDIPLLIRLLEYAREDSKTDMDLHNVAERLISMSSEGETLGMDQYDAIVGKGSVDEEVMPTATPGATAPATTPAANPSANPAAMAQMKAQQLKQVATQKKQTQDQIKQTQDQLNALRKQQAQLNSPSNIAMPGVTGTAE